MKDETLRDNLIRKLLGTDYLQVDVEDHQLQEILLKSRWMVSKSFHNGKYITFQNMKKTFTSQKYDVWYFQEKEKENYIMIQIDNNWWTYSVNNGFDDMEHFYNWLNKEIEINI